jgi:tetratricopeptide (TPR) repeat protein
MTAKAAAGNGDRNRDIADAIAHIAGNVETQGRNAPRREALLALRKAVRHFQKGEWAPAAIAAAEAADHDAKYASAFHLLALSLDNLGQRHKAFEMYERALALDPHDPDLYLNIGTAAWSLKMYDGAEKAFRAYIEMRPDCSKGYNNLAGCLRDKGQLDDAIALCRDTLMRMPEAADLWNTLGTIMGETCDFDNAVTFYKEAMRLDPKMARAYHNLGYALNHVGPLEEAIANYTRALELCGNETDRAEILHARGFSFLAQGRLVEGWAEYEARHLPHFSQSNYFAVAAPRWAGEDLERRKLLVVAEQGLGDEIMFASLIPDLIERVGPQGKVLIACDHRLVPLFQRSFPETHVGISTHTHHNAKPVRIVAWAQGDLKPDFFTPMGSPLGMLRKSAEDFPRRAFLKPDPTRVCFWQDRLEALGPGPYVGICWRSMLQTTQRKKFFSTLEMWRPVLEKTCVKFINIQYGDAKPDIDRVREKFGVAIHTFDDLDLKMNLDDNAALCAALDLAVSAPTAAGAIAAATGTETWFLLPAPQGWTQLGTDHYPWYAKTRVLAPERFGDWPVLLNRLAREIESFAERAG